MNYFPKETSIVFQELPDEISLTISIAGCGMNCKGCHSPHLQNSKNGELFLEEDFIKILRKYTGYITAVIFFNGDLFVKEFISFLDICKEYGLKTALYTGYESVNPEILKRLDFLKIGSFIEELGGLANISTNQKMINVKTKEDITYKFQKEN